MVMFLVCVKRKSAKKTWWHFRIKDMLFALCMCVGVCKTCESVIRSHPIYVNVGCTCNWGYPQFEKGFKWEA